MGIEDKKAAAGVKSEKTCRTARLWKTKLNDSDVRVYKVNSTGAKS